MMSTYFTCVVHNYQVEANSLLSNSRSSLSLLFMTPHCVSLVDEYRNLQLHINMLVIHTLNCSVKSMSLQQNATIKTYKNVEERQERYLYQNAGI